MSLDINLVNLGDYPNDGTGDDLRTAFEKSNANFRSLEDNVVLSAVNLGDGAPVWLDKVGNDLRFRSISSPDDNLTISYDSFNISLKVKDFLYKIEEDLSPKLGGNLDLNSFEIYGDGDIDISGVIIAHGFEGVLLGTVFGDVFGSVFGNVNGFVTGQVSDISNHKLKDLSDLSSETPEIGNSLIWDGEFWRPGVVNSSSTSSLNDLTDVNIVTPAEGQIIQYNGTSWTNTSLNIDGVFTNNYDFGLLSGVRSPFDLLFQFTNIDFGSLNNPSNVPFDLGGIEVTPPAPPPPTITYILTASSLTVNEGSSVTITLTTTNLANGSVVPYIISGVSSNDINGTSLTGSFVVFDNTSSLTIPITLDLEEENETLTLTLVGITPTVSISIDIIDFEIPLVADNGGPETEDFDYTLNGGTPSDESNIIIDGGIIETEGLTDSTLSGGSPSDTPTVIADGEGITDPVSVVLDGGELI